VRAPPVPAMAEATAWRSAQSAGPQEPRALAEALLDGLAPFPEGANFGVLYATDHLVDVLPSLLAFLREKTGIGQWTGTVGFGVLGTTAGRNPVEHFDVPALSALIGRLPPDDVRLFGPTGGESEGLLAGLSDWAGRAHPLVALVHADPRTPALTDKLTRLAGDQGLFLVGGLSGSRGPTPLVARDVRRNDQAALGLAGALFAGQREVVVGLTQGCSPIGPVHQVTGARGNLVEEIDGRPALEVFKAEIGDVLARDLRRVAGYILVALPVSGSDTGDYLVRNLLAIDPRAGTLAIGDLVLPGQPIRFVRRDHDAAVADLDRMVEDVARRAGGRARAGLYVSCVARGPNLFGPDAAELRRIVDRLGPLPLTGFYANGEICADRLYGYTGVLALFC